MNAEKLPNIQDEIAYKMNPVITKPTLIVDKSKAIKNIEKIWKKIRRSPGSIRFRPHFKTHQSIEVGRWFKELGITCITVSSVDMAAFFAADGWNDITIAFLVNPLQIQLIDELASTTHLGLLVDSIETVLFLQNHLTHPANVWIKIDTAYHRTGIEYQHSDQVLAIAQKIQNSSKLTLKGILTHSGHSYNTHSTDEIKQIYHHTVSSMNSLRNFLAANHFPHIDISIGDTPTCSIMESFTDIDEIRCGNFVYYDAMQLNLGSCNSNEIATAAACPIIGKYPQRNQIAIYGGAVHLSKDFIINKNGQKSFGLAALPINSTLHWDQLLENTFVSSISQEHGIISTTPGILRKVQIGDILLILPIHSCLTANLLTPPTFL